MPIGAFRPSLNSFWFWNRSDNESFQNQFGF
jgi:hypothetical protein